MPESILLQTLKGTATSRPPVWFMRQAGRILPSYLKIKEKYTFWQMLQNPKVAAEVTLLPVYDLKVDAAILFSDILVIPYAMGMGLDFTDAIKFIYQNLATTQKLAEEITELSIIYAKEQIWHGVEVFQLFDTHAGMLPFDLYQKLFMPFVKKIATAVREENVPFIFFPKGLGIGIAEMTPEHCDFLSIDWQSSLPAARKMVNPEIGLQGNIDPRLLYSSQEVIKNVLNQYVEFGSKNQNWIFNLGHGFIPGLPYENARFLVDWVKNTDWKRTI